MPYDNNGSIPYTPPVGGTTDPGWDPNANNGTSYYAQPCGVATDSGFNPDNNNGTQYYYNPAYDFILWGFDDVSNPEIEAETGNAILTENSGLIFASGNFGGSTPSDDNNNTHYYYYPCSGVTDPGWDPNANNGSEFHYDINLSCVSFCP